MAQTPTWAYWLAFAVITALVVGSLWLSPFIAGFFLAQSSVPDSTSTVKTAHETGISLLEAGFAGIAMAGVIVTLWMQRDELANQREQLRLQTDEMIATNAVLAATKIEAQRQANALDKQVFEHGFFQLLSGVAEQRRELLIRSDEGQRAGFEAMRGLSNALVTRMGIIGYNELNRGPIPLSFGSGDHYADFWPISAPKAATSAGDVEARITVIEDRVLSSLLGSFYAAVGTTLKFVDQSRFEKDADRRWFAEILRSQLSRPERVLLAYHCLGPNGRHLLGLFQKYEMFTGLRDLDFAAPEQFMLLRVSRDQ